MASKNIQSALVYIGTSLLLAGTWLATDWQSLFVRVVVHSVLWFSAIHCLMRDSGSRPTGEDREAG